VSGGLTLRKIGHIGDVLSRQSVGLLL